MCNLIITQELVDLVLCTLEVETTFGRGIISYEVQDDFRFILISIPVDGLFDTELTLTVEKVGNILNRIIPKRTDTYSWMVVFTKFGKVVDSCFGGNLESPNSGL